MTTRDLGAGTTPRFLLLSALVLVTALSCFEGINIVLVYDPQRDLLGGIGCYLAAGEDPAGDHAANQLALKRPGVAEALETCLRRFDQRIPVWPLVLEMGLLIAAATILYWVLPLWKGRRGKVVPLDERIDRTGELCRLIDDLVAVAGLARPPRFVVDPAARTPSAVVFGRWRRYTVCLHGALLTRRFSDPAGFRGVVLHELAHLRNRDVDITYATVALWRVFLVVLPADVFLSIAYLLRDSSTAFAVENQQSSVYGLLQTAFLVVLVYLARADVLRVRELHADVGAAQWGADPRGWQHRPEPVGTTHIRRAVRSFAALWRTHPDWAHRERILTDPAGLFGVQRLPVFLTGAAVLVCVAGARSSLTVTQWHALTETTWAATLLGSALATAVVGMLLWRAVVHAMVTGQRSPSGVGAGLWFGAGMVTGELVLGRTSDEWLPESPQFLLVLLLIGTVITWWTARHAALWARICRAHTMRFAVLLTLTATWLVFGMWFAWWHSEGQRWVEGRPIVNPDGVLQLYATHYPGILDADADGLAAVVAVHWVLGRLGTDQDVLPSEQGVMWAGGLLWLMPLLTCLWRPAAALPEQGLPLRRIVRGAAGGGLLVVGSLGIARALVHDAIPHGPEWLLVIVLHASVWTLAAVGGAVAVTALIVGARSGEDRLLVGLTTAGVTALLGLAATFVMSSADGCLGPLNVVFDSCGWRPGEGLANVVGMAFPLLGPGIFAVAAAMLLVANLPERIKQPRAAVLRRPRLAVIGIVVAAVAVIAANGQPRAAVSSSTADGTAPTRTEFPVASSPRIHSIRVLAWLKYGGQELLNRIADGQDTFTTAVTTPPLTYADVVRRVRPVCVAIERDVAEARAYFPVSDSQAQRYWTTYLDLSGKAATTCRKAIDARDFAGFRTAGQQMERTFFAHRDVFDRFGTFFS